MRTTPDTANYFEPIENIIRHKLIPALTGRPAISDLERELLAFPCRLGGFGIPNFTSSSTHHFRASQEICSPITKLILDRQQNLNNVAISEQQQIKLRLKSERRKHEVEKASNLNLPDHLSKAVQLSKEKGSSNWLTTLPLDEYGFSLNKSEFQDALHLKVWLAT